MSDPLYPPLPAPRVAAALKKIDRFLPFALESIAEELLLCGIYVAGGDCSAADFGRLDMRESRLEGVVFDRCDFSGARFAGAYFERCSFSSCKMMGAGFPDAVFKQVSADASSFAFTGFDRTKLSGVRLRGCDLTEAAFSEVRLRHFAAEDCRFVKTTFFKTPLAGVDFRQCELVAPILSQPPEELRGAIVSPAQAASLATLLGVLVQ